MGFELSNLSDLIAVQAGLGLGGHVGKPGAAKFRRILARLGRVRVGRGNAVIVVQGDSNVRGTDGTTDATQGANGLCRQIANALTAQGFPASAENVFGMGGYEQSFANYEGRIAVSGSFNKGSGSGLKSGGGQIFNAQAVGTVTYAPTAPVDTIDIHYLGNGASFTYAVDGGAPTMVNAPNDSTIRKLTVAGGPLGAHSIQAAWISGNVNILGFVGTNAAAGSRVDVLNFGWHGSRTGDLTNATQGFWSADKLAAAVGADLVIYAYGGTNDWRNSVPASTYIAHAGTQIGRYAGLASPPDLLLATATPDGNPVGLAAGQQAYADALLAYALTNGIPSYDCWRNWGDAATMEGLGALASDKLHRTRHGAAMDADRIVRGILG